MKICAGISENRKQLPKYLHHFNSLYLYTLIDAGWDAGF